jgi:hypothetical protein
MCQHKFASHCYTKTASCATLSANRLAQNLKEHTSYTKIFILSCLDGDGAEISPQAFNSQSSLLQPVTEHNCVPLRSAGEHNLRILRVIMFYIIK